MHKIYKVTKTKTKLYGKHPVTMYNLHTKNKKTIQLKTLMD